MKIRSLKIFAAIIKRSLFIFISALLLLLFLTFAPKNTAADDLVSQITALNNKLNAYNTQAKSATASAQLITDMVTVATSRKPLILELMKKDPAKVSAVLITYAFDFPSDVQAILEKKVSVSGKYVLVHSDMVDKTSTELRTLYPSGDLTKQGLNLLTDIPNDSLVKESSASISGYQIDNNLFYIASDNIKTARVSAAIVNPPGNRRLLVIYTGWGKNPVRSISDSAVTSFMDNFKTFNQKSSNGKSSITYDYQKWDFGQSFDATLCGFNAGTFTGLSSPLVRTINSESFTRFGYFLDDHVHSPYDDYVIMVDSSYQSVCTRLGGQSLFGPGWIFSIGLGPIPHEFGHNMWLAHANGYECDSVIIKNNCDYGQIAYGPGGSNQYNFNDIMGFSNNFQDGDYGAYGKEFLGWLDAGNITTVTTSGTYTINSYSDPGNPKVLKIPPKVGGVTYYIQYRKGVNTDDGARIEIASNSLQEKSMTAQLDMTPDSFPDPNPTTYNLQDWSDAYIHDNQQFNDVYNGLVVKALSHNASTTTLQVTFGTPASQNAALNVSWNMPAGYVTAVGQKKDVSWAPISYIVSVKCLKGFGCPVDWQDKATTTDNFADVILGAAESGYSFQWKVDLLTKDDINPTQLHRYVWIPPLDTNAFCNPLPACNKHFDWNRVNYRTTLTQASDGRRACTARLVQGVIIGCEDFSLITGTNATFHGLPPGINFNAVVKVRDINDSEHLLQDLGNIGQSYTYSPVACVSSTTSCTFGVLTFVGYEPLTVTTRMNDASGVIVDGPIDLLALADGSIPRSWLWDYYVVAVPLGGNCFQNVIDCVVLGYYRTSAQSFSTTIGGLKYNTDYSITVCAMSCNPPAGQNSVINASLPNGTRTGSSNNGPAFLTNDPFLKPPVTVDSDGDGFIDSVEVYMGTDPYKACSMPGNIAAWPPDFNNDGKVGFADLVAFASHYGAKVGDAKYDRRFDLDADGKIGFGDLVIFAGKYNQSCTPGT